VSGLCARCYNRVPSASAARGRAQCCDRRCGHGPEKTKKGSVHISAVREGSWECRRLDAEGGKAWCVGRSLPLFESKRPLGSTAPQLPFQGGGGVSRPWRYKL